MKRSVNFSAPAKFAALAAMRAATTETWLAEPSADTKRRCGEDCETLMAERRTDLSAALSTACNCVSHSEPRRNVGDLIYAGYDQGWRVADGHFVGPNGETRQAPTLMWLDAVRAIQHAAAIRARGNGSDGSAGAAQIRDHEIY